MPAVETKAPNRLGEARRASGLTQPELAELAGTTRASVARIEAGRQSPAVEVAIALAAAVGENVESIFGGGE